MKFKLLIATGLIIQAGHAQNFFTKGLTKLAKVVGNLQTEKVNSLDDIVATVAIGSNLHTDKLGAISQTFFNGWKTGGDAVSVMFSKKNSPGYFKIDGTVTVDGKPMEFLTAGTYGLVSDANPNPRKIEVTTTSGQKASFKIEPIKKRLKLLSINGQKDGDIALDLTKDVTLELEVPAGMENARMKVSIAINQLSIKSIYDVCYTKAAPKIIVPANAFRNVSVAPASSALYSFKNSYLSVGTESMEEATEVTGKFTAVKYTASHNDGKLVSVSKEPDLNKGLFAKGTDKDLDMKYDFFKPNAFMSRPFEHLKTIGLRSFSIRGTTFSQSSKTTETSTTITTTTTTLQFPMQPDSVWDALLESAYPRFVAAIEEELGAKVLPVEAVTHADAYKNTTAFAKDDQNTKVNFTRAFRDTKVISAFMPVTDGYGSNGVNQRIMDQIGADGLLTMTMDLEISSDGKLVLMVPKFGFEIVGKTNGPNMDTKYCSGSIQSITGVSFKTPITPEELRKIIRESSMVKVFRKGLQDLKEKEKANGDYGPVWALQK
ncbi:MAG: hypothetical protein JWP91_3122 [Fibrobacteres bacterium]|nr:hypothetical protein [Fibrobacterota bacterium]